jgi:hypothetical protein
MAARQTQYAKLPEREQKIQEKWAQHQLQSNAGKCGEGTNWYRVDGGCRCCNGSHKVTDELLAEGKGGYLAISGHLNGAIWNANPGTKLKLI